MKYQQFLQNLYAQNQFVIKYDLKAIRWAVQHENLKQVAKRIVLVAGTNGKGTISSTLNAIAITHGWKVGLFTSPHLVDFRERIRMNGLPISKKEVQFIGEDLLRRYNDRQTNSLGPRTLSFFELTLLIALIAFKKRDLDLIIFEVGLGGRLDATNALDANIAIFGSIALDHQHILGNTLEKIATEKAAIARKNRQAIIHPLLGGSKQLQIALQKIGANVVKIKPFLENPSFDSKIANKNIAISAFQTLLKTPLRNSLILNALTRHRWPGRQEKRDVNGQLYFIDGAHNEEAMFAWANWMDREKTLPKCAIVGLSPGRDAALLTPIYDRIEHVVLTQAINAKAIQAEDVFEKLTVKQQKKTILASSPKEALFIAPKKASGFPVAVVGSLYLVGEIYAEFGFSAEDLAIITAQGSTR